MVAAADQRRLYRLRLSHEFTEIFGDTVLVFSVSGCFIPIPHFLRNFNFSSRNLKLYLLRSTSAMPSTTDTMFCSEYSRPAVKSLFGVKAFAITSASRLLSRYG